MSQRFHFTARGHENISSSHLTTLEVTKDSHLSPKGDCIVAVEADFDPLSLKRFLQGARRLSFTLACQGVSEVIEADCNPSFKAGSELVIRRSLFASDRTLATGADRACFDLDRDFVEMIKNPDAVIEVTIEKYDLP